MSYASDTKQAFCTASKQLKHDPIAIVNHLQPIFEVIGPNITTLNFLSDSPSSQYRNKSMFYSMFHFIIPSFPNLNKLTWNYSESGHGKGAPDGIGAVVKRTADKVVSSNAEDIANFETFFQCIEQRVKKVKIIAIKNVRNSNQEEAAKKAPAVKGMKNIFILHFHIFALAHWLENSNKKPSPNEKSLRIKRTKNYHADF